MDPINLIEGYSSALQLTEQLITLSTAVIALSITFTKDLLNNKHGSRYSLLKISWAGYLLSICFGIWAMMSLTGMIFIGATNGVETVIEAPYGSAIIPSALQIFSFVFGTLFIILYAIRSLNENFVPPDSVSL